MRSFAVRCSLFAGRGLQAARRGLQIAARGSLHAARRRRGEGNSWWLQQDHGRPVAAAAPPSPHGRGSATERAISRVVSQLPRSQRGVAGVRGIPIRWFLVAACLVAAACRSTTPPATVGEHAIAPLTATTAEDALRALRAERNMLGGARALLHVRVTVGEDVQSFKASIDVHGDHMELTAFTPLGTTAMSITTDGDRVHVHDVLRGQDRNGTTADLR